MNCNSLWPSQHLLPSRYWSYRAGAQVSLGACPLHHETDRMIYQCLGWIKGCAERLYFWGKAESAEVLEGGLLLGTAFSYSSGKEQDMERERARATGKFLPLDQQESGQHRPTLTAYLSDLEFLPGISDPPFPSLVTLQLIPLLSF